MTSATHRKLERHEASLPARRWHSFAMTRRGRMSWADWFHRAHYRAAKLPGVHAEPESTGLPKA